MNIHYNIARHTLETIDGTIVAKLTPECSAERAFMLQDALQAQSSGHLGNAPRLRRDLTILAESAAPQPELLQL